MSRHIFYRLLKFLNFFWKIFEINLIRSFVIQRRMKSPGIVKFHILSSFQLCFKNAEIIMQKDTFIFVWFPVSFNENIIQGSAFPIHADFTPWIFKILVNSSLVNWLPWSVLKISGTPYFAMMSSSNSTQKALFKLFEILYPRIFLEKTSIIATL